jgi:chaperone modulatory protein CbpM
MTNDELIKLLTGDILEKDIDMTLGDLSRACQLPAERVIEFVEEGVIEPIGRDPARWRFQGICVRRVRCAQRLQHDLGVNTAGAALAIDLLEELERLRARLQRLEN